MPASHSGQRRAPYQGLQEEKGVPRTRKTIRSAANSEMDKKYCEYSNNRLLDHSPHALPHYADSRGIRRAGL